MPPIGNGTGTLSAETAGSTTPLASPKIVKVAKYKHWVTMLNKWALGRGLREFGSLLVKK